jgi:hypothetical protein
LGVVVNLIFKADGEHGSAVVDVFKTFHDVAGVVNVNIVVLNVNDSKPVTAYGKLYDSFPVL